MAHGLFLVSSFCVGGYRDGGVGVQDQKHTENGQEKKHLTGILYKEFAVTKENIHRSIIV